MTLNPQEYTGTVTNVKRLSPKTIWLKITPDKKVSFTPGQYASLFVGNNLERLYSFAAANDSLAVEFVIDTSPGGPGSNYAKNIKEGDIISFLAPFGRFVLNSASNRRLLLIATGTGIAPLRSIIQCNAAAQEKKDITLLFGNRSEEYVLFHEEFLQLSRKYDHFTYLPVCSQPTPKWPHLKGRVNDIILNNLPRLTDYDSYVCGSSPVTLSVMATLRGKGVPDAQIYLENYT